MTDTGRIALEARDYIANHYNPENDTMPGLPRITFTEAKTLEYVAKLADEITKLKDQLEKSSHA